jgi:hypothetical protein
VVNRYRYDALNRLIGSEEAVANSLHARAAAGAIDDGHGILYANGVYLLPDSFLSLRGSIGMSPPPPDLTPQLAPPAMCLFAGPASCALSGAGRRQ